MFKRISAWWLVIFLLLAPVAVLARAGGGQSFHSASSSGGSHSSSSNSGSHSSGNTYNTYNNNGYNSGYGQSGGGGGAVVFAIVILIIIVVVLLMLRRGNQAPPVDFDTNTDANAYPQGNYLPAAGGDLQGGLAKIEATDPNFSQQVFIDRVQTAFYAIQTAWQKRDLAGGRAYLSDGMVRRFQMQIDELTQKHRHNVLDNLVIGGVHLIEASQEGGFDSIKVKIAASAADYTLDDQTQQIVEGSKQITPFIEYWTFARTTGTKSVKPGDPAASKAQMCPSCGGPLSIGETGKCSYCGNEVKGMSFDWVLNNIGQASEE